MRMQVNREERAVAVDGHSLTVTASDLHILCGAKGNRTPDLLDANETRYQLRYSPLR